MKHTKKEMIKAMKTASDQWNSQPFEIRKIMSQSVASDSIVILLNEKKALKVYYQKECKRVDAKIDDLIDVLKSDYVKIKDSDSINTITNRMNNSISSYRDSNSISEDKKDIKGYFIKSYELKLKEITGNDVKAPWAGKEAKLLCQDYETHGRKTLIKYIDIFFSDRDRSVADFTRYKTMAGYSFGVFHGMISKLAMSKVKPTKACRHCGWTVGHDPNCLHIIATKERKLRDDIETNRLRDENKDFSFIDAFNNKINRKGE